MIYTVGEMAQKLGVPASTLRYYDKEGLLPFVERSSGGIRMFRENDFEWLQVIRCICRTSMRTVGGASGQYLRNAPLPRKSFSNIRNLRQRATSQREMGHHLTVMLPENRAQSSLPEL